MSDVARAAIAARASTGAPGLLRARLVATACLVLAGAACFRGSLPPLERYRLALPDSSRGSSDSGPVSITVPRPVLDGALAITPYRTPGIYGDPSIVYRIGEHRYGSYPSREWALPLSLMLGQLTERVLTAHPLSLEPAIYSTSSRMTHSYEWQGFVREFEEVNRERDVLVSVAFDVRLVRTADDVVIWQGSTLVERPVPDPTISAIVTALSESAASAITWLVEDARSAIERTPPEAQR